MRKLCLVEAEILKIVGLVGFEELLDVLLRLSFQNKRMNNE